MSGKNGKDFVEILREIDCPGSDKLQGKDVEWLWETPAKDFMEWICNNITKSNCLTDEEAKKWALFPKENTLTGEKLQTALESLDKKGLGPIMDDNEVNAELEIQGTCITNLKDVKSNLDTQHSKLTLLLSNLSKKLQTSEVNLSSEQKKLIRLNSDLDSAINELRQVINEANRKNETFTLGKDLTLLFEEHGKVRDQIKMQIAKRFSQPLGRDMEEFEDLVGEIHRLRFSIQNIQQKEVIWEAKCKGSEKGLEETKTQLKLLVQDMLPKGNLDSDIVDLEKEILDIKKEIDHIAIDLLPQRIEEQVANRCSALLKQDLKCKAQRQKYVIKQLEIVLNLLLELTASQEILGAYLMQESQLMTDLEDIFKLVGTISANSDLDSKFEKIQSLQARDALLKRRTIVPWDKGLLLLNEVVTGKRVDPSMITYDDIICLIDNLAKDYSRVDEQINEKNKQWIQQREETRDLLGNILKEVAISVESKGYQLSPHEMKVAIKNAESEGKKLTIAASEAINEWDNAYKNVKENPMVRMERELWKSFMNNPASIEKAVETMRCLQKK